MPGPHGEAAESHRPRGHVRATKGAPQPALGMVFLDLSFTVLFGLLRPVWSARQPLGRQVGSSSLAGHQRPDVLDAVRGVLFQDLAGGGV